MSKNHINHDLVRELHFGYNTTVKMKELPQITSTDDSFHLFLSKWDMQTIQFVETFMVLYLTRANKVIGVTEISKGGTTGTVVDAKVVFSSALACGAVYMVLAHNHPSGNIYPSPQDIELTKNLVAAGEALNIKVLDHLIITPEDYYSFAEEGKI